MREAKKAGGSSAAAEDAQHTNLTAMSPSNDQVGLVAATAARDVAGRVLVPISIGSVQDGTYWFELRLADRLVTRIPLHVTNR